MSEPKRYPGNYIVGQVLEGKMASHQEWVAAIAGSIGSSVEPDNAQYINRFTVPSTSSSAVYLVSQRRSSGEWCCSCPSWKFQVKKGRGCKHLTDILQRLAAHAVLDSAVNAQSSVADGVAQMLASAKDAYSMLGGIS
jgi:hypothetical protein